MNPRRKRSRRRDSSATKGLPCSEVAPISTKLRFPLLPIATKKAKLIRHSRRRTRLFLSIFLFLDWPRLRGTVVNAAEVSRHGRIPRKRPATCGGIFAEALAGTLLAAAAACSVGRPAAVRASRGHIGRRRTVPLNLLCPVPPCPAVPEPPPCRPESGEGLGRFQRRLTPLIFFVFGRIIEGMVP